MASSRARSSDCGDGRTGWQSTPTTRPSRRPAANRSPRCWSASSGSKRVLLEHREQRILAVSHGILLRFFFAHSFLEDFRPDQVPRMWQLRTLNCGLSALQHRPLDAGAAYPSPGEWLCLTWMARPWDPL